MPTFTQWLDVVAYRFTLTYGGEVGYSWGAEKKNACKNNCGPLKKGWDYEPKKLADLLPPNKAKISLWGFLKDKCKSGKLTGAFETYKKSWWDWGVKGSTTLNANGTSKEWIPQCCKCAHFTGDLNVDVKAKARVGLQLAAVFAISSSWKFGGNQ